MRWLLILPLLSGACIKNPRLPDLSAYAPKVRFDKLELGDADWTGIDTTFVLSVENRSPVSVRLAKWSWALDVSDTRFLDGDAVDGVELQSRATHPLRIPVRVGFAELINTAKAARGGGEIPYDLSGEVSVQTPIGPVAVPYGHSGELPAIRPPRVAIRGLRLQSFDALRSRAELVLDVAISGQGGAALQLQEADWTFALSGRQVADGVSSELGTVEPDGSTIVSLPIGVNLLRLASSTALAIQKKSPVEVSFGANLSVGTPLGVLPLRVEESGSVPVR